MSNAGGRRAEHGVRPSLLRHITVGASYVDVMGILRMNVTGVAIAIPLDGDGFGVPFDPRSERVR